MVNGVKYEYPFINSGGHPFLGEDKFFIGYVVINGRQYTDLKIKYDICIQKIVLNYTFFSPDIQCEYMVIVRGISDNEQPMHGECNFTEK